jgi:hypothetical protein
MKKKTPVKNYINEVIFRERSHTTFGSGDIISIGLRPAYNTDGVFDFVTETKGLLFPL